MEKRLVKSIVKTLIQIRTVHLLGHIAGIKSHQHIGSLETKSPGPFESRNNERISAVDLGKDACHVIIQIVNSAIRTHISEHFDFEFGEV
jgi:hypothetical protein